MNEQPGLPGGPLPERHPETRGGEDIDWDAVRAGEPLPQRPSEEGGPAGGEGAAVPGPR